MRMSGTCEPMWKCSSLKQWPRFSALSISVAASNLGGAQAELGVFAARSRPTCPAPLAQQPRADADERLDAQLLGDGDDLAQFLELLDDHDDLLAQLGAQQRHADEIGVLVAVADDQAAQLALQRQAGEQLRLAAHFEAEIERLAGIEDFLDHLAELVDLDGKHAAVFALVIELGDGAAEGQVDGLDAVAQDVLEPDQHRELQPARLGLLDDVGQVHRRAGVPQRLGDDVPGFVDVEVLRAPAMNVVQVSGVPGCPTARWRRSNCSSRALQIERTIKSCAQKATAVRKSFSPGAPLSRFAHERDFGFIAPCQMPRSLPLSNTVNACCARTKGLNAESSRRADEIACEIPGMDLASGWSG